MGHKKYTPFSGTGYKSGSKASSAAAKLIARGVVYGGKKFAEGLAKKFQNRVRGGSSLRGKVSAPEMRTLQAHSETIQDGTGGQLSTHTFINNKSKLTAIEKKLIRPVEYTVNGAAQASSSVGRQAVYSVQGLFNQGDIATMLTKTPLPASGSGSVTSYPTILCESFTAVLSMKNVSNANLTLTIYDIIAKRDASVANSFAPDLAWNVGASLEGTTNASLVVGALPTDSDLFNQFYKIQKRTSVILAPGNLHRHETFSYPHQVVSSALTSYIGSNGNIGGLTTYVMIVISGDIDSDQVTGTQVSVGAAYLNYAIQADYRFRFMLSNQPDIYKGTSLITSYTVAEETINPETGAAQAFTPL